MSGQKWGFSVFNTLVGLRCEKTRIYSCQTVSCVFAAAVLEDLEHRNDLVFQHMEPSFARLGAALKEAAALWQFRFPSGDRYVVTYWCNTFVSLWLESVEYVIPPCKTSYHV
jgi:hypothetical protein